MEYELRLTDRTNGKQRIVSFAWASIQVERMYAAPQQIFDNWSKGLPLVTQNWVYEPISAELAEQERIRLAQ